MRAPKPSIREGPELSGYALVIIDLQTRIVEQSTAPHPTREILARVDQLGGAFRRHGLLVVFVRSVNLERGECDGDEIAPQLTRHDEDIVITKHQWGAFHGTPLDLHLRRRAVRGVVLAGVMTNFGVEGTARAADELGYDVVLAEDASSSESIGMHEFALRVTLARLGVRVVSTDSLLRSLG